MAITFSLGTDPVILSTENAGSIKSGCYSRALHPLGTTQELTNGVIVENSQSNWYARVRELTRQATGITIGNPLYEYTILNGASGGSGGVKALLNTKTSGFVMTKYNGGSGDTFTSPIGFTDEWWSVYNNLSYGNTVVIALHGGTGTIGFTGALGPFGTAGISGSISGPNATGAANFLENHKLSTIFQITQTGSVNGYSGATWTAPTEVNDVITLIEATRTGENPVIGIINAGISGSGIGKPTDNDHICIIAGRKLHLGLLFGSAGPTGSNQAILTTHLSPDIAGIIAASNYYQAPAGSQRGIVKDVIRLEKTLSDSEITTLTSSDVNYTKTINGIGTMLLNDLMSDSQRIHITRIIDNIRSIVTPILYNALFEINDVSTRSSFINNASFSLNPMIATGAITSVNIVCDTTNNTPTTIAEGKFIATITFVLNSVIRTVEITVSKSTGG